MSATSPSPRRESVVPYDVQRTVHRATVPIGVPTPLPCVPGDVVHVDAREPGAVDVWYLAIPGEAQEAQPMLLVIALGTGDSAQPGSVHLGTALSPAVEAIGMPRGVYVWHLWTLSTAVPA